MTKVNHKIYPVAVITEKVHHSIINSLHLIASKSNVKIDYNFKERFFEITAENEEDCDQANELICSRLLPLLNEYVDAFSLTGTFENLDLLNKTYQGPATDKQRGDIIHGKPLEMHLKELEMDMDNSEEDLLKFESGELEQEHIFTIEPKVHDIEDILIGPPQFNMLNAEYINLIPMETGADCAVISNRSISITGNASSVAAALKMLQVVQKTYLGQKYVKSFTCVNTSKKSHFGLYYCNLSTYKKLAYLPQTLADHLLDYQYVLLAVPVDHFCEYGIPKDLLIEDTLSVSKHRAIQKLKQSSRGDFSKTYFFSRDQPISLDDYNYKHISRVLREAIESVKGFKGLITLSAKLGKILWSSPVADIQEKVWHFMDIETVLRDQFEARPRITDMLTSDDAIITVVWKALFDDITDNIKTTAHSTYEFHCLARNRPKAAYTKTIMTMKEGCFWFEKVIINDKNSAVINSVCLEKIFDYQIQLNTQMLTRTDVKPFRTFARTISFCPVSSTMKFSNVPHFLMVNSLLLKKVKSIKSSSFSPFIIDIIRTEKVPLKSVPGVGIVASLGQAEEVAYDIVIRNDELNSIFKTNLELGFCEEALWNVNDILGLNSEKDDVIKAYLSILNKITDKIDKALNS
ncbi:hypothetical protein BDF20DRAFT_846587 [Mycotypha africana]|uniref:uncharacterized protein n=1 Tax=Mycotypha africana TaxID=64632 RepID=UPI0023007E4F|nr:uncharacterized protein BDF20DRAFT_846587 [Mycotypha africana]KAI8991803.1 hypothetical protein BDF20DRAFT_846587 [Mycotypha africana]